MDLKNTKVATWGVVLESEAVLVSEVLFFTSYRTISHLTSLSISSHVQEIDAMRAAIPSPRMKQENWNQTPAGST